MNRTSRSIRLLSAGAALTIAITLLHGVASMAQPTARAARPGEEGERDRRLGSRDDAPASVGFGFHCGHLRAGYGIDIPHSRGSRLSASWPTAAAWPSSPDARTA